MTSRSNTVKSQVQWFLILLCSRLFHQQLYIHLLLAFIWVAQAAPGIMEVFQGIGAAESRCGCNHKAGRATKRWFLLHGIYCFSPLRVTMSIWSNHFFLIAGQQYFFLQACEMVKVSGKIRQSNEETAHWVSSISSRKKQLPVKMSILLKWAHLSASPLSSL